MNIEDVKVLVAIRMEQAAEIATLHFVPLAMTRILPVQESIK